MISVNNELYHYGVRGMKWGIRRYQKKDGSLTPEGKKRAKSEYKADNEEAFNKGKDATVSGHAAARSMKRTIKLENRLEKKYEKDPEGIKRSTQNLHQKWQASAKTTGQLVEAAMKYRKEAEEHCKSLMRKYGKEAVSSIKYKDVKVPKGKYSPNSFNTVDEKTNTLSDYAKAGAMSLVATGMMQAMGIPFATIYHPPSTADKARTVESSLYRENLETQKKTNSIVVRA